ncbi:hypothetical protein Tco_0862253 [Tanacetum coccineum]
MVYQLTKFHVQRVDMVLNPPWNLPFLGAKGLTSPEQTATGKGISNPLMAVMQNTRTPLTGVNTPGSDENVLKLYDLMYKIVKVADTIVEDSIVRSERYSVQMFELKQITFTVAAYEEAETIHKHDNREQNLLSKKFTSRDGDSMESYYSRFYKLMNELTRNNLQVSPMARTSSEGLRIGKRLGILAKYFKKLYKPTQQLRTSSIKTSEDTHQGIQEKRVKDYAYHNGEDDDVQTDETSVPLQIVQLILFIVDSGCTMHMTGNLKLLCNFVEKFMGTVRFGNDQFAPILGYGDLIEGKEIYLFCERSSGETITKLDSVVSDLLHNISSETSSSTPIFVSWLKLHNQGMVMASKAFYLNFDYITFSQRIGCECAPLPIVEICLVPQGQKASDYDNSDPVPPRQNVVPSAEKTDSSQQGLEFLFSPLLEEYYNPTHGSREEKNIDQATNASFQEKMNLSILFVHGYKKLFELTVSIVELKNIKEAMADSAWIEAMQDELKAKVVMEEQEG